MICNSIVFCCYFYIFSAYYVILNKIYFDCWLYSTPRVASEKKPSKPFAAVFRKQGLRSRLELCETRALKQTVQRVERERRCKRLTTKPTASHSALKPFISQSFIFKKREKAFFQPLRELGAFLSQSY